jgi:hypothetical protein
MQSATVNPEVSNHLLNLTTSFKSRNYFTPGTF